MGYVSKDIAIITDPKVLTLAGTPNFVQFASKPGAKALFEYNITINVTPSTTDLVNRTLLRLTAPDGVVHAFHGTTNTAEVGGSTFLVSADKANTAENLRLALLNNSWVEANYDVRVPFTWPGSLPVNGTVINIKSKGTGIDYNVAITAPNNTGNSAYTLAAVSGSSLNNDSITGEAVTAQIELDVYVDPDVFLGTDDRPVNAAKLGTFAVTMQKTYAGAPLWFELNALFEHYTGHNEPPGVPGWFPTGTVRAYRFIAKKRATDSYTFYASNALFVVNGYARPSDPPDLNEYLYGSTTFKLLTNAPRLPYVKGQRAYLNFIYQDPEYGIPDSDDYNFYVLYRAFSTSGEYLGRVISHTVDHKTLAVVNTCELNIDAVLGQFPTAGIIRVGLGKDEALLTTELVYDVRPDCLHELTQFTFLNRLGGYDAFNFDALPTDEIKPNAETFNRAITPDYTKGTGIETVYSVALEEAITIEGAPVNAQVAEWLKELAASRYVLDGDGRYVVIDDLKVRPSETTDDMYIPTLKYHYSETYTND